ncbi:S1 family peptidase [Streptomyces sp. DSM 44917]|uniref:S1 family peptidase n=1 Tax=Streptomyces boetiae TaxID=3075541 RepID=A0ABU2LDH6_9ACTN|nr:S1 family peptidase [Streptomyces sp. DSM 44917]MDT0309536.1 S1 family peptidase [Streptomyces sp. DSM 44917]
MRLPLRRSALSAALLACLSAAALLLAAPGQGAAAERAPAPRAFGAQELAAASAAVRAADVPGTAWAVDRASGRVRVTAGPEVPASALAALRREAGDLAPALALERAAAPLRPFVSGGERVYSPGGQCTAGFNTVSGSAAYLLTAGHCTTGLPTWYTDPALTIPIGPSVGSSFPGNDFGLIRYTNPAVPHPGTVVCNGREVDITGWRNATVGMTIWIATPTGCRSGTVTGVNFTVNYGGGQIVSGLTRTNACAEPGDSGAPAFSAPYAIGLVSGGSGNCSVGGTTYLQPVGEALAAYGLTLL